MTIKNTTLSEFEQTVGFWENPKSKWDNYTDEQKSYLESIVEELEFEYLDDVQDFIWYDADDYLRQAGLLEGE